MGRIHQYLLLLATLSSHVACQEDTLGLDGGFIDLATSNFKVKIVAKSHTLASLQPADSDFDFLPYDLIKKRPGNGQYHWGDITYRYKKEGDANWTEGNSASNRQPIQKLDNGNTLATSGLGPTLPSGPLNITREWLEVSGDLALRFTIGNTGNSVVEIGSLGLPAEFNSIFTGRTAVEMQRLCSLSDPYIGMDAGYIRTTPISGTGKALVVTPLEGTNTPMEAYRNLHEPYYSETAYGSQTFEGFYEWQVMTRAWAENEWANQEPWNPSSSRKLEPGESVQVGVRFSLSDSGIRGIDDAIQRTGVPVARSIPGYIVPRNLPAQLFLRTNSSVASIKTEPAGAFQIEEKKPNAYTITPSGSPWGRVRMSIEYEDGKLQTIHYFVTESGPDVLTSLGKFLTTKAVFNDTSDPFGRAPSIMTYDYEAQSIVDQDSRVWIAGLSDEGGAGAYVAAMLKQTMLPNANEISILEEFVDGVLWGMVQNKDYSVRKSVFFYEPSVVPAYQYNTSFDWSSWTSWNKEEAYFIDRAYDYVHVSAAYWSLYRVARAYPDIVSHTWDWYLDKAHGTVLRCMQSDVWYNDLGLMGETVFGEILKDLQREGKSTEAQKFETAMRSRAELWHSQEIPYGSEMAWDSTGQEGVSYWTRYFGFDDSVTKTINSVLGYMPSIPHWGWHGNARRYWDFIYGGKLQRIERQIHHYGSGLNSQVLLSAFRDDPSDSYLLQVGYGGSTGPLSNINQDGFPSAAFHSFPNTLKWDGITGDYGMGFLGMALNGGTYVAEDEELGPVAYGGILSSEGDVTTVLTRGPTRRRIFIGPLRLLVSVDAGFIEEFSYDAGGQRVSMTLVQEENGPKAESATIWVETSSQATWKVITKGAASSRGGWSVSLSAGSAVVVELG